jgi:hypothetical protein
MNSLQQAGPSMPGFDYGQTFGTNPWLAPTQQIGNLVGRTISSLDQPYGGKGGGASGGAYQTYVARPNDQAVQDYMSHVMGGQRNQLDEYVRRAAGAGIQRSGMNVRGGPALSSSLHHSAMQNLAGGYSDRFRQAMDYNKYLKGQLYNQYQNQQANLQNMLNTQHRYLTSQADWANSLGMLQHSDWKDELNWRRGAPTRALQIQQALQNMARQREQDQMTKADWDRNRVRQNQIDSAVRGLEQYGLHSTSIDPFAGHSWAQELALTGRGIAQPWNRQLKIG